MSQVFHHVGATPWIHDLTNTSFFLQNQLRIPGDASGKIRGQGNGFVQRIGMQRLCAAKYRGHGFNRRAHDIVVGILLGQRPTRSLAMGAQHAAFRIGWLELVNDLSPQQPRRTHFRDLHIEIHTNTPEKTEAWREIVNL